MNSTCVPKSAFTSPTHPLLSNGSGSSPASSAASQAPTSAAHPHPLLPHPAHHPLMTSSPQTVTSLAALRDFGGLAYQGRLSVFGLDPMIQHQQQQQHHQQQQQQSIHPLHRHHEQLRQLQQSAKDKMSLSVSVSSNLEGQRKPEEVKIKTEPETEQQLNVSDSIERLQEICDKNMPSSMNSSMDQYAASMDDSMSSSDYQLPADGGPFTCHVCAFSSYDRNEFNKHVNEHYEHFRCIKCDYMTKEEEEYRSHLNNEHGLTPEALEDEQGVRIPKVNSQGKVKTFKCKHCEKVFVTKKDFWAHSKEHIKPDKMLQCSKCPFVTEFKHHMDYHVRNHYGSKPFKCPNCSYSCVNKSMLSSHMKSHLTVYQYRCQDCSYATKYCHSLKLHLRKYNHQPAVVLNPDGTPNPLPIIDIYGTRRGPKIKRTLDNGVVAYGMMPELALQKNPNPDTQSDGTPTKIKRGRKAKNSTGNKTKSSKEMPEQKKTYKCTSCQFETVCPDIHRNHNMLHEARERGTYPITSSHEKFAHEDPTVDHPGHLIHPDASSSTPSPLGYIEYLKRIAPLLQSASGSGSPESHDSNGGEVLKRLYLERFLKSFQRENNNESEMGSSPSPSSHSASAALDLSHVHDDIEEDKGLGGSHGSARRKGKAFKIKKRASSLESNEPGEDSAGKSHNEEDEGESGEDIDVAGGASGASNDEEGDNDDVTEGVTVSADAKNHNYEGEQEMEVVDEKEVKADVHRNKDLTHCDICDITFSSVDMYEVHAKYHSKDDSFKCAGCGEECPDKVSFFKHLIRSPHNL